MNRSTWKGQPQFSALTFVAHKREAERQDVRTKTVILYCGWKHCNVRFHSKILKYICVTQSVKFKEEQCAAFLSPADLRVLYKFKEGSEYPQEVDTHTA